jgi:hypothetical protein
MVQETFYDYHADNKRIGKSGLDLINKSPLKYYFERIWEGRTPLDTKALRLGKFYHAYLFEPERLSLDFYILKERAVMAQIGGAKPRATNAYKEWLANEVEECGIKTMVSEDYADLAQPMKDALLRNPSIAALLNHPGECEKTVLWETRDGVKMKSKLDKYIKDFQSNLPELDELNGREVIIDYKTTEDAGTGFLKSAYKYRYDVQNAMYIDSMGGDDVRFIFIVQEKSFPYLAKIYQLTEEDIERAREIYLCDVEKYKSCMEKFEATGDVFASFEGYENEKEINTLFLPSWER